MTLELRLLLACAKVLTSKEDEAAIRHMLDVGIDWTLFARKAIDHGLAGLAGHTLARVAPDMAPDDILDATRMIIDQTRKRNRILFDELAGLIETLAHNGIDAIALEGPVLAIQAYGDLGLRMYGSLDFLVRESDMAGTMTTLLGLGYERKDALTGAQIELIQRLQGKDLVYKKAAAIDVEPHTRLTPITMALDIDYAGLWRRAMRTNVNGRSMPTPAPEDHLVILAIHGGRKMWWNIKWTCDVAAFISSHPKLDWAAVVARARAQGCLRMVLLATTLARKYFNAAVPDAIAATARADPLIEPMIGRVTAHWQSEKPIVPQSNDALSMDRLRLHDGIVRRTRYMARTLFLPGAHHVAAMPTTRGKIAHGVIALTLARVYQRALAQAGRLQGVLGGSDLALAMLPASAETKLSIKRHQIMLANAKRVLAADPKNLAAWRSLGHALLGLKRYKQAIAAYDKALALEPENRIIWKKRGEARKALGEKPDFSDLSRHPKDADGWNILAGALWFSDHLADAVEACDRALSLDSENIAATRLGIHSRLHSCDWRRREEDKRRVTEGVNKGAFVIRAMDHRGLCDSEAELRLAAHFVAREVPIFDKPLWHGERYRHNKIRIAYQSTDFHRHAVASLIAGCFEHHDKTRFETYAISLGKDDGSEMRRRVVAAFDRFIDVQDINDARVARMLRELEIDVAIDLNGYTGNTRAGILSRRPAPVQVNYLGFAGTMDLPFMDYIIADRMVIPEEHQIHYREKVVYLPHTYLPNDSKRPIAEKTPSRTEAGLPETGFIFACMNHTYKIGPEVFEVWMRLLGAVEGSVLWLRSTNSATIGNLRLEAKARGVAPERLVFAPPVARAEDHLARLRLADLFLDTQPYNAHATACDALWAGLPVLTRPGNTFPSRVAASVLYAVGLPELVTASLAEYEELARALAQHPERLAALKAKLMHNRDTEPLFDTARFTHYLESAYTTMWERQQADLPPASFAVASVL